MDQPDFQLVNIGEQPINGLLAERNDLLNSILKLINGDKSIPILIQFVHKLLVG